MPEPPSLENSEQYSEPTPASPFDLSEDTSYEEDLNSPLYVADLDRPIPEAYEHFRDPIKTRMYLREYDRQGDRPELDDVKNFELAYIKRIGDQAMRDIERGEDSRENQERVRLAAKAMDIQVRGNIPLIYTFPEARRDEDVAFVLIPKLTELVREKYNPDLGNTFSTLAVPSLKRELDRLLPTVPGVSDVRITPDILRDVRALERAERTMEQLTEYNRGTLSREQTTELLAQETGFRPAYIQTLQQTRANMRSLRLDQPLDASGTDASMQDTIASPNSNAAYERIEDKLVTRPLIESLPEREQQVLTLRYGLKDGVMLTQQEVGDILGMTRNSVSTYERRALANIRKQLSTNEPETADQQAPSNKEDRHDLQGAENATASAKTLEKDTTTNATDSGTQPDTQDLSVSPTYEHSPPHTTTEVPTNVDDSLINVIKDGTERLDRLRATDYALSDPADIATIARAQHAEDIMIERKMPVASYVLRANNLQDNPEAKMQAIATLKDALKTYDPENGPLDDYLAARLETAFAPTTPAHTTEPPSELAADVDNTTILMEGSQDTSLASGQPSAQTTDLLSAKPANDQETIAQTEDTQHPEQTQSTNGMSKAELAHAARQLEASNPEVGIMAHALRELERNRGRLTQTEEKMLGGLVQKGRVLMEQKGTEPIRTPEEMITALQAHQATSILVTRNLPLANYCVKKLGIAENSELSQKAVELLRQAATTFDPTTAKNFGLHAMHTIERTLRNMDIDFGKLPPTASASYVSYMERSRERRLLPGAEHNLARIARTPGVDPAVASQAEAILSKHNQHLVDRTLAKYHLLGNQEARTTGLQKFHELVSAYINDPHQTGSFAEFATPQLSQTARSIKHGQPTAGAHPHNQSANVTPQQDDAFTSQSSAEATRPTDTPLSRTELVDKLRNLTPEQRAAFITRVGERAEVHPKQLQAVIMYLAAPANKYGMQQSIAEELGYTKKSLSKLLGRSFTTINTSMDDSDRAELEAAQSQAPQKPETPPTKAELRSLFDAIPLEQRPYILQELARQAGLDPNVTQVIINDATVPVAHRTDAREALMAANPDTYPSHHALENSVGRGLESISQSLTAGDLEKLKSYQQPKPEIAPDHNELRHMLEQLPPEVRGPEFERLAQQYRLTPDMTKALIKDMELAGRARAEFRATTAPQFNYSSGETLGTMMNRELKTIGSKMSMPDVERLKSLVPERVTDPPSREELLTKLRAMPLEERATTIARLGAQARLEPRVIDAITLDLTLPGKKAETRAVIAQATGYTKQTVPVRISQAIKEIRSTLTTKDLETLGLDKPTNRPDTDTQHRSLGAAANTIDMNRPEQSHNPSISPTLPNTSSAIMGYTTNIEAVPEQPSTPYPIHTDTQHRASPTPPQTTPAEPSQSYSGLKDIQEMLLEAKANMRLATPEQRERSAEELRAYRAGRAATQIATQSEDKTALAPSPEHTSQPVPTPPAKIRAATGADDARAKDIDQALPGDPKDNVERSGADLTIGGTIRGNISKPPQRSSGRSDSGGGGSRGRSR